MGCAASSATKNARRARKANAPPSRTPSGWELLAASTLEQIAAASDVTVDELTEFAEFMEVDSAAEPHLLRIVAEAMNASLPKSWMECEDPASGQYYYCNTQTHETTWDNPLDRYYKNKLETARACFRSLPPESSAGLAIPTATSSVNARELRELSGGDGSSSSAGTGKLPASAALWEYEEPLWEAKGAAAGTPTETVWVPMQADAAADLEAAFADQKMGKMIVLQRRGHSGIRHSYIVCLKEPMMQMNRCTGRERRIRRTEPHSPPVVIAVPVADRAMASPMGPLIPMAAAVAAGGEADSGVVVQVLPGTLF